MKHPLIPILAWVLLTAPACLMAGDPVVAPVVRPGQEPPDVPAVKLDKTGEPSTVFLAAHESFLRRAKQGPIDLLFIGDSITAGWPSVGKQVWAHYYAGLNAANFGVGGDRTQNVLWRIEHGELAGISPKVVVLLIGVNNGGKPEVFPGVRKIVDEIRARLPESRVLLLGVFPHGNDPTSPPWIPRARAAIIELNKRLAALDDGKNIRFLDIGGSFLDASGAISKEIMPDGLHPGPKGYQLWAEAMKPLLDEMLAGGK